MKINLSKQQKENAVSSIQRFFDQDIEIELGELQAALVLEFFEKEIAPFAYNQGIEDAKHFLMVRAEDLSAACYEEPGSYWKKK